VTVQADPPPDGDPAAAEDGVGDLQGDRGHVPAGEGVGGGGGEGLGVVAALTQRLQEAAEGDPVAGEGVGGQAGPGQPVTVEGDHLAAAALTDHGPLGAVAGGGTGGAADLHLLAPMFVRLAEGDPEGEVLAGATITG
jgi:hypothetical protein